MNKNMKILLAIAVVISVLAVVLSPKPQRTTSADKTHPLLADGLKEQLNEIDEIIIEQGENIATIAQSEEGSWHVKEHSDYPASTAKIREALLYLSQSELRSQKTSDPEKFERIGLSEALARHITLKADGEILHHIILGNITRDALSTYVQVGEDGQSYVTTGRLEFQANPNDWLFYDLFSIHRKRVKKIAFNFTGKQPYQFSRTKRGEHMALTPLPDDKEERQKIKPLSPSVYFEKMLFTDVKQMPDDLKDTPNKVVVTTFDGLVLTLYFHEIDFRDWVQMVATTDKDEVVKKEDPNEKMQDFDTTRQEAAAINQRTKGWLYEIGQFQYTFLRTSYFDLVKDKE